MKTYISVLALVSILLSSCGLIEEPTVLRIEDVDILEMNTDKIDMEAKMIIHNPNNVALDLASADLNVILDDITIGNIKQQYDLVMPAKSDFEMPVNISLDLKNCIKIIL